VHDPEEARLLARLLYEDFRPGSVLDVGCGTGNFLHAFARLGVTDRLGVDGEWVDRARLRMPAELFRTADLEVPLRIGRRFDLVLCLEVAEHVHAEAADTLVDSLTAHGDLIVFSAAIPGQGGQNHVNEQPVGYWIEKFARRGYRFHDVIRPRIWNDERIHWWYRQNMFVVATAAATAAVARIERTGEILDVVHPALFRNRSARFFELRRQHRRIMEGRMPKIFYLKRLIRSFLPGRAR
jgi:SAM-dependent methyltransferase